MVVHMSNFGFGMHSGNNDDDDRDDRNRDEGRDNNDRNDGPNSGNPFEFLFGGGSNQGGFGDLGGILDQFGSMINGFTADLNSDSDEPLNFDMVERVARQQIDGKRGAQQGFSGGLFGFGPRPSQQDSRKDHRPSAADSQAVAESVRLAELWLDEVTTLPAGATGSVAFGPEQWLEETLPTWKRILNPLAAKLGEATMADMPEEMKGQMGPIGGIMQRVNAMNFSMQLGQTMGELADGVTHSTEWGMPLAEGHTAAIATKHLDELASRLGTEKREALIYLACREAAHHRLFQHVPWLAERLILDVEEFARGLTIDSSAMEEATREFNPEMMGDPEKMQEMMNSLQNQDLAPKVVSTNKHALERLETRLSLVEGWVDFVVGNALSARMPNAAMLNAAWSSFRGNETKAMESLKRSMGISLVAPKANDAADLWYRLDEAVGMERRDGTWDHPDLLPDPADLDNPAGFIGRVGFGADEMDDFDPISEIEKLEKKRREQETGGEGSTGDDAEGNNTDGDKGNDQDA